MTEEDLKIIEQISPSTANALRTADKDSAVYKAALETVESPEFQTKLDVLKGTNNVSDYTQTEYVTEYNNDGLHNNSSSFSWTTFSLIISGILVFVVLILILMNFITKKVMKKKLGKVIICTCTECNDTRKEQCENVVKGFMGGFTKYNRIRKEVHAAGFGIGGTYYKNYQKKIYCPECGKKTWHEIENINDVMYDGFPTLKEARDRMFEKEMNKQ